MKKRILDSRIGHMHGVAEYIYAHAENRGLNKDSMYLLGLLHDIGYVNEKINHEQFGYEFLNKHGYIDASYIKWHGETPKKYKEHNACSDSEIPQELILLWEADMHIDQTGNNVGYEYRLEDIGKRLGFGSKLYSTCKETIEWLCKNGF